MRPAQRSYKLLASRLAPNDEACATDALCSAVGCEALDRRKTRASLRVMLQHNAARAHIAHAAVVGMHAICCGVPTLALFAAALSGTASATILAPDYFQEFHRLLHGYEVWILGISAGLVALGAWFEASIRHGREDGFPWLFALSVSCFLLNAGVILLH